MDATNSRLTQLADLAAEYHACTLCGIHRYRTHPLAVVGAGNPEARLFFIGEAPGPEEDAEGSPVSGNTRALLQHVLHLAGSSLDEVWMTNTLACMPRNQAHGRYRAPSEEEVDNCSFRVKMETYTVDPRVVVALGLGAIRLLVGGANLQITTAVGKMFRYEFEGHVLPKISYPAIATWSPQSLLRYRDVSVTSAGVQAHSSRAREFLEHVTYAVRLSRLPRAF